MLNCFEGHEFEAWFRSSADYDEQRSKEIVECPECGSYKVEKAIMAPNVSVGKIVGGDAHQEPEHSEPPETTPVTSSASPIAASATPAPNDIHGLNLPDPKEMVEAIRQYRTHVLENAENVGDKFSDEARKIHYEEKPARGIYGNATPDEVQDLLEEGIDVAPLPKLPEDNN